jgi:hypothetical protein
MAPILLIRQQTAIRSFLHSKAFPLWIASICSGLQSLNTNAEVYLVSPLGRLQVNVSIMEDLHPDAVVYRRGDWMAMGGGINQLISERATNIGGGAAYYHQCVRLENG